MDLLAPMPSARLLPLIFAIALPAGHPVYAGDSSPLEPPIRVPGMENAHIGDWAAMNADYLIDTATDDDLAADLANRGWYQLQLFRSPEAARHLIGALRHDPECGIAWVGLALALLEWGSEGAEARQQAAAAALATLEQATAEERAWILALDALEKGGTRAFAAALEKAAEANPRNPHAPLMRALILRDGFDTPDTPGPGQNAALAIQQDLADARPDDPLPLHLAIQLWLVTPNPGDQAATDARRLIASSPPSGYLMQAAAMLLARLGHHTEAAEALGRARLFEEESMTRSRLAAAVNPTYLDTVETLCLTLAEAGQMEEATAIAAAAREIGMPWDRPSSVALRTFAFFTLTLEARLHARAGQWEAALKSLPPIDHPLVETSHPSGYFLEFLASYLQGRIALENDDADKASALAAHMDEIAELMQRSAQTPNHRAMGQHWQEATAITEYLRYDLRTHLAASRGDKDLARIWWSGAAERWPPLANRPIPRWPIPPAESHATATATLGRHEESKQLLHFADLQKPGSGWILSALAAALRQSGEDEAADKALAAANRAWSAADPSLATARNVTPESTPE